jgi:NitT/TauT family transport system permease protein
MAKALNPPLVPAKRGALGTWLRRGLFYAALLLIWELLARSGIWPDYTFPGPVAVLQSLIDGFQNQMFLQAALASLARLAIGYAISLVIGIVLGLLIRRFHVIEETVGSLVLGLQALPSVCWLPLAILWFGLNDQAIIFSASSWRCARSATARSSRRTPTRPGSPSRPRSGRSRTRSATRPAASP